MTFVRTRARILEISTTSGSGPFALAGAADGSYNNFASFMSIGDQTFVTVVEPGVAFWSGIATYSASNQLTLTTVEEAKGTFGAGTKEVMASPLSSASMLREDISGSIVTGGTSTAYTVASFRKYGSLSELDGSIIAFTPHVTNGQGAPVVSLNVDGLVAKPVRADPARELPSGVLIAGTPYTARFDNTAGIFLLHGIFGGPYSIPLGASIDFFGSAAPSSAFALAYGQAISRSVYSDLFTLFGTTYGVGDGTTTFNIPDLRGRVVAGADGMGGAPAGRLNTSGGMSGTGIGAVGGGQTHAITASEVPTLTSTGNNNISVNSTVTGIPWGIDNGGWLTYNGVSSGSYGPGKIGTGGQVPFGTVTSTGSNSISVNYTNGSQAQLALLQPTIAANKLLRIL